MRNPLRPLGRGLRRYAGEILVSLGALAGWGLLTWGAVDLTAPVAWKLSAGLLLLSLCGWRFLGVLASQGLYTLSREEGADD